MKYPSVTQILKFVNQGAFDSIPLAVLEAAASRGTDFHSAAAAILLGVIYEPTPEIEGYIRSLEEWANRMIARVIWVEEELVSHKYQFCGHPDALVQLAGDEGLTLIDHKTPVALSKGWRVQLGGYRLLCIENGYQISRVASLRPQKDGSAAKFDGYSKTMAADTNVFISALNVYKFFNS